MENRRFLGRAVRYLAGQGVRQFLDIGAGLPTQDNVHQIAHRIPPGSYLVLSHATGDVTPAEEVAGGTKIYSDDSSTGLTVRSRSQVEGFLTGLDLVDPGLVLLPEWRPDSRVTPLGGAASYGAVGRVRP